MIDKRNDWDKICGRLKDKGPDRLWNYITALRSMDTKKGRYSRPYIKTMLTNPLRGVHYRVEDIRATYEALQGLRSRNDVLNLMYNLMEDIEHIENHYIEHTVMGWRAIEEEDIADHLERMEDLDFDYEKDIEELDLRDNIWCFVLICKINNFVRKICVRGGIIG